MMTSEMRNSVGPSLMWLMRKRPDAVRALVADVEARLDAVRRLRLARDRWALRAPELRRYRAAIASPVDVLALFARVKPPLYRLREGDWRFIYRIDGRTVRVLDLIRRRDLDDWLRRRR